MDSNSHLNSPHASSSSPPRRLHVPSGHPNAAAPHGAPPSHGPMVPSGGAGSVTGGSAPLLQQQQQFQQQQPQQQPPHGLSSLAASGLNFVQHHLNLQQAFSGVPTLQQASSSASSSLGTSSSSAQQQLQQHYHNSVAVAQAQARARAQQAAVAVAQQQQQRNAQQQQLQAAAALQQQQQQLQQQQQQLQQHHNQLLQQQSQLQQQQQQQQQRAQLQQQQQHKPQQQPQAQAPQQPQNPNWSVPNPLSSLGLSQMSPQQNQQQQQIQLQQQRHQQYASNASHAAPATTHPSQLGPPPGGGTAAAAAAPAAAGAAGPSSAVAPSPAPAGNGAPVPAVAASSQPAPKKLVLTAEAKQALAKAIWSAIRSPTGEVAPDLMEAALKTGLPRQAILNASRVAREREAQKRRQRMEEEKQQRQQQQPQRTIQQPPQQQQQQIKHAPSAQHQQPAYTVQQPQQHQQLQQQTQRSVVYSSTPASAPISSSGALRPPVAPASVKLSASVPSAAPSSSSSSHHHQAPPPHAVPSKPQSQLTREQQQALRQQQQQQQQAKEAELKAREKAHWRRVQCGAFMVQKGRFLAVPYSVGAMVKSQDVAPVVLQPQKAGQKRTATEAFRAEAAALQQTLKLKALMAAPEPKLLDPSRYKRVKVEPKKFAKALDRLVRKSRQAVAEGLSKQHKEVCKTIYGQYQEFFKFHRQRKADALKLAKTIRDSMDKEVRKREKDAAQAERARLAALKANDMTAYSKLLEETKNERLKFLLDRTETHFTQISSLLQKRQDEPGINHSSANAAKTTSYYATAHSRTEEVRQPTILVGGDLKEYQLTGLQWLVSLYNNKLNGILADEMGLGKTIQAISLVAYLMEFKQNLGPFLVIVPLSTLSNWQNEFTKWCPSARTVCYKGTPVQRKEIYKSQVHAGHFNVLLTTYEYIIKDKKFLRKIEWQYAIVDEGHRMKNAQSKFAVTLGSQYTTRFRVLLTGTPLMNDLSELWSLLNFLLPSIFNSVETFDQWFSAPFAQFGSSSGAGNEDEGDQLLSNEERILVIHRLHELLRPFMLRRVKSEVLDQLPEKIEKVLRCDLSSWQKELYKQISAKAVVDNGLGLGESQVPTRGLNNIVMQLRKVCNHPFLFSPEGYHINDVMIRSSGKFALLDQMLPKLKMAGHRCLIFTQMTAVMTILEDYFSYRGYLSLRLDGSTPAEEREKRMYKFNAPDSPYFIFLLSTRAGGLGLNLTAADTVIILDSDWNPMMDLQAQDRAHRIGQRSDVSVFRLITNSPVEEKILSRATEKLNVSELVVESGQFNKDSVENDNSLERKRMMEVLLTDFDTLNKEKSGVSEKSGSDGGDDDDDGSESSDKEDLNELLSNNEADYQLYTAYDKQREEDGEPYPSLYISPSDVPDWIWNPHPAGAKGVLMPIDQGPRKRKDVMYDDGLTEKQFLRIMEKQAVDEESNTKKKKKRKGAPGSSAAKASGAATLEDDDSVDQPVGDVPNSDLTDWTFRKLISCSKCVVALKEPGTKRRVAEIFLEKPDPATFPDYYEIIEKPIAINDILRKCRAKLYAGVREFREDWNLMFANARKFNGENSWVVEDAKALEKELERVLKKNGFSDTSIPIGKKKKLRIKLSLKDIKAKGES